MSLLSSNNPPSRSSLNHLEKQTKNHYTTPPTHELAEALRAESVALCFLAGDGSDREYFRVSYQQSGLEKTCVLMQLSPDEAKPLLKSEYEWITVGSIMARAGIHVPNILAVLPQHGTLLIEDYGDTMLETAIHQFRAAPKPENQEKEDRVYEECFQIIEQMLSIEKNVKDVWCQRSFDQERLAWEMRFFRKKYLEEVLQIELQPLQWQAFEEESDALAGWLSTHSNYFVHRDFHSRNLMIVNSQVAVIDFQDARLGPPAYDLVSLVFDSYIPLPLEQRLKLMEKGVKSLKQKAVIEATWKETLLQRQYKAIGSFGYLTTEKGKGDYLKYVEPALATIIETDLSDSRWPFISQELPALMKNALQPSTT